MSGLAQILRSEGASVAGSDTVAGKQVRKLENQGISVHIGHAAKNILNSDLLIKSLAIPSSNPELIEANKKNIPIITYPQALSELSANYFLIAVAGSHGKTTTTAMTSKVLIDAGFDPTVIVGANCDFLNDENYRAGASNYFILEACEYMNGFNLLKPTISIITNIDHDHFDSYPTERDYLTAFTKFIRKTKEKVILNMDYPSSKKLDFHESSKIIRYSSNDLKINLKIPGRHNVANAGAVLKLAAQLNIDEKKARVSLADYNGASRRLELVKQYKDQLFFDDYGHHPTEIIATLNAIREKYGKKRICLIYQPHQHSRSGILISKFKNSFDKADKLVITDIYAARDSETDKQMMSSKDFYNIINRRHKNCVYISQLEKIKSNLDEITENYDIVIVMGAGDINKILN